LRGQQSLLALPVIDAVVVVVVEARYDEALLGPRDPEELVDEARSGAAHVAVRAAAAAFVYFALVFFFLR
jgi:hypothetical protein